MHPKSFVSNFWGALHNPNETTDSYIYSFIGYLRNDKIDKATFFIIGPEEKEQFCGDEITLYME